MLDWRPIEGHDCKYKEKVLLWDALGETFYHGVYKPESDYFQLQFWFVGSVNGWRFGMDQYKGHITHYARITGPDAPNPVREGIATILKTIEGFIPLACCLTAVNEESFIAAAGIARKLLGEE